MVRNPEMPRVFWDGCGVLHEQRSLNILPVVPKVPVMQSRVQVADGSQPQEFDPPAYLPVNTADLEGGTQNRGVQPSSHFQVDSVPKLRRCFCCATLVLVSLIQALMLDHLDPTAWKVALKSKRRVAPAGTSTPNLLEPSAGTLAQSLAQSLRGSTAPPQKAGTTMPDPSPFGVLFLGSKSFLKINCFKFVRLGVLTVTVLRLLTKLSVFLKQGVGVKKRECWQIKRFPWVHRKRFGYYGILLLEGVRRECLICMLMAW